MLMLQPHSPLDTDVTPDTISEWPLGTGVLPPLKSHSLMLPSSDPDATRMESTANFTLLMPPEWPSRRNSGPMVTSRPFVRSAAISGDIAAFHIITHASLPPEATNLPLGLTLQAVTRSVWPRHTHSSSRFCLHSIAASSKKALAS